MRMKTKEIALFGMLGAVMFASKMLMELLPNIHLLGMFIVAVTVVYRKKALYPIYIYVLLNGIVAGFATWWIPYLYIWTVLWAAVMLLPKNMPKNSECFAKKIIWVKTPGNGPKVPGLGNMRRCDLCGFMKRNFSIP